MNTSIIFLCLVCFVHIYFGHPGSIYLTYFLFIHLVIIDLREMRKISRRGYGKIQEEIRSMLGSLTLSGVLQYRPNKKIPYVGYIGSPNPTKTIFLKSGMHGLEYFSIQSLLIYISSITKEDIEKLKDQRVQLIVVPIINWYGFIKYRRTNSAFIPVDLARNYVNYVSPLNGKITRWPFAAGWGFKINTFRDLIVLPFALFLSYLWQATDYFKGFRVQKELLELKEIIDPIIKAGQELCNIDIHTGNPEPEMVIWSHEFDTRKKPLRAFQRLMDIFNKPGQRPRAKSAPIDYETDGAFYEGLSVEYRKYTKHFNGWTIELPVLENREWWYAFIRYMFDTIFEPFSYQREWKLNECVELLTSKVEQISKPDGLQIAS